MIATGDVRLLYHRPPDRSDVFDQKLITVQNGCYVTLLEHARLPDTMLVDDNVVLEDHAPIVWFTFEGAWHDIGRFHRADGTFTGYYANIIVPVTMHDAQSWECTDLFLDVWLGADDVPRILDNDELEVALAIGAVDARQVERARMEAAQIVAAHRAAAWPPAIARDWSLERVRANN